MVVETGLPIKIDHSRFTNPFGYPDFELPDNGSQNPRFPIDHFYNCRDAMPWRLYRNTYYPMKMVRHDGEFIQHNIIAYLPGSIPFVIYDFTGMIQMHFFTNDFPEKMDPIACAGGNEIIPRGGIIPPG